MRDFVRLLHLAAAAGAAGLKPLQAHRAHMSDDNLDEILLNETAVAEWQGSKVRADPGWVKGIDRNTEAVVYRLYQGERMRGRLVLCVGARGGGEVRAFRRMGAFAVGIDLEPAPFANDLVLRASALALPFADETVDYVFSNIMDHIPHFPKFCSEVARVLRPDGYLILEVLAQLRSQDAWAVRDTGTRAFYDELGAAMKSTGRMAHVHTTQRVANRKNTSGRSDAVRWRKLASTAPDAVKLTGRRLSQTDAHKRSELTQKPLCVPVAVAAASGLSDGAAFATEPYSRIFSESRKYHALTRELARRRTVAGTKHAETAVFVGKLQREGMLLMGSSTGMDFSWMRQVPLNNNSEVNRLHAQLGLCKAGTLSAMLWRQDQAIRKRVAPPACRAAAAVGRGTLLQQLLAKGYAKVNDWGLDAESLVAETTKVMRAKNRTAGGGMVTISDAPLSVLDTLLANATLAETVRGYFGGEARYDGHMISRIGAGLLQPAYYPAVQWHHDRCGRRLKAFIFVDDVTPESHPTQVAAGTHNTLYYATDLGHLGSRYADEYVRAEHPVADLSGPRGGGFIFDTNMLHRGVSEGAMPRRVIMLEFHPNLKAEGLNPFKVPCPSYTRPSGSRRF